MGEPERGLKLGGVLQLSGIGSVRRNVSFPGVGGRRLTTTGKVTFVGENDGSYWCMDFRRQTFGQEVNPVHFETDELIYVIESAGSLEAADWMPDPDSWTEPEFRTDHEDGTVTVRISIKLLEAK